MKQRKPMSRGTGFKRPDYAKTRNFELAKNRNFVAGPAPAGSEVPCGFQAEEGPVPRHQVATLKPLRRGTYAAPAQAAAIPKQPRAENKHLLGMARGGSCLLTAVEACRNLVGDTTTTVACHQNEGKGMARKQDDFRTVRGCAPCHEWLDRSGAPRAEKRRAFMAGHLRQVVEWRAIVADTSQPAKDRLAAQWALDQLNATPVGAEGNL